MDIKSKSIRLLILCQTQFGSHIDTYQYCKHLRNQFEISYLCWDYARPKQSMEGVKISYILRKGNLLIRNIRYLFSAAYALAHGNYDICFIKYFRGCFLLKLLFPSQKFIFDIRTGSVNNNRINRLLFDQFMIFESFFFKHVTVISPSLANKLNLQTKAVILPLGSEVISEQKKNFDRMDLLYVGTFNNRHLEKTIMGFSKFYKEFSNLIPITYTIIGDGYGDETNDFIKMISSLGLSDIIKIEGRVPFEKLKPYFDNHNIGISFVPITNFFNVQPVTKSFDYLLSGMPIIATATLEHNLIVDERNGVLIPDTPEGFFQGLKRIYTMRQHFDSHMILQTSQKYNWYNIVMQFGGHIKNICGESHFD